MKWSTFGRDEQNIAVPKEKQEKAKEIRAMMDLNDFGIFKAWTWFN